MIRVAEQLAVTGLIGDARQPPPHVCRRMHQRRAAELWLIPQEVLQPVAQLDPDGLPLASHNDVYFWPAHRFEIQFLTHDADVGAAQHHGHIGQSLDGRGRAPGGHHLRRVGGDAHDVWPELPHDLLDGLLLHVTVVDAHLVAALLGDRAKIGQPQVRGGAGVNRQSKFGVDQ